MELAKPGRGVLAAVVPEPAGPVARGPKLIHATRFVTTSGTELMATSARTTSDLPRREPPKPRAGIARLVRLPVSGANTEAARAAPTLPQGPAARRKLEALVEALDKQGVDLAAGAVQLIALPRGRWTLRTRGDAARVVALGRAGRVLLDVELTGERAFELPAATERLAVWSLGRAQLNAAPGFGALSLAQAPRSPIAVGWHAESQIQIVDPVAGLARGAALRWSQAWRFGRSLARASELLSHQSSVETALPAGLGAVLVSAAVADPSAADFADLAVGVSGGTLGTPLVLSASGEQAALYPVTSQSALRVTVASESGYRLTGVIGLRGRSDELAARLHGTTLAGLVADGPLTLDGSIHFTLQEDAS
jgi:hypothetical protein